MSLSQEPVFSRLKDSYVCGYLDITKAPYSGKSGWHETDGQAIDTTNGAGPHNLQLFVIDPDGTVLHCLAGYWNPGDLAHELELAERLQTVWRDRRLTRSQKNYLFSEMQMVHFEEHSKSMRQRSRMQGFDQQFEAKKRLFASDTIKNAHEYASAQSMGRPAKIAFKTTDQIMHERMAERPFVHYRSFDVAEFSDYGQQQYDKQEDLRNQSGGIDRNKVRKHRVRQSGKRFLKTLPQRAIPIIRPIVRNAIF